MAKAGGNIKPTNSRTIFVEVGEPEARREGVDLSYYEKSDDSNMHRWSEERPRVITGSTNRDVGKREPKALTRLGASGTQNPAFQSRTPNSVR